jgi:hypothetical protein
VAALKYIQITTWASQSPASRPRAIHLVDRQQEEAVPEANTVASRYYAGGYHAFSDIVPVVFHKITLEISAIMPIFGYCAGFSGGGRTSIISRDNCMSYTIICYTYTGSIYNTNDD